MSLNKKQLISIVVVIIIICAGYLFFFYTFGEEEEQKAMVSFRISDDTFFNITCEIADSESERNKGLMHRENLPEDEGMLFVYDNPQSQSFWMKNTLIPLDIIFIHENKTVLNVHEADLQLDVPDSNLTRYESNGSAKWVVEINQGLSAKNGITSGTKVSIKYID
jgi:uncharacterized membrane protein (UPF0127 family)